MKKVDEIRQKIDEFTKLGKEFRKQDLADFFPGHRPLVEYALKKAVEDGFLVKHGKTRGVTYTAGNLPLVQDENEIHKIYRRGEQSEEDIFAELQDDFLRRYRLSEDARHIVSYAFTEMVNNAIDHSESEKIMVSMSVYGGVLRFTVRDFGIGVFRNVMQQRGLPTEKLALAELTKGKVTTAPKWHSGEGIFFTSRAADVFRLSSGFLILERLNNGESKLNVIENDQSLKGTLVEFSISVDTDRHLAKDVFGQFESEPDANDFGRTEIEVSLFNRGDVHVSRSQAKRIMTDLEKFKVVTLDFAGIPFIGQGFADQIFRVFSREHPDTKLVVKNATPDVQFMIDRVDKG